MRESCVSGLDFAAILRHTFSFHRGFMILLTMGVTGSGN